MSIEPFGIGDLDPREVYGNFYLELDSAIRKFGNSSNKLINERRQEYATFIASLSEKERQELLEYMKNKWETLSEPEKERIRNTKSKTEKASVNRIATSAKQRERYGNMDPTKKAVFLEKHRAKQLQYLRNLSEEKYKEKLQKQVDRRKQDKEMSNRMLNIESKECILIIKPTYNNKSYCYTVCEIEEFCQLAKYLPLETMNGETVECYKFPYLNVYIETNGLLERITPEIRKFVMVPTQRFVKEGNSASIESSNRIYVLEPVLHEVPWHIEEI